MACLDVEGRRCVVVGDGDMADEKIAGLEACGAVVDRVPARRYKRRVLARALRPEVKARFASYEERRDYFEEIVRERLS